MRLLTIALVPLVVGCAQIVPDPVAPVDPVPSESGTRPVARPDSLPTVVAPPPTARTAEQFDTTTAEERVAAAAPVEAGETHLGVTIASLGNPAQPGFWLETPLVKAEAQGRVEYQGKSSNVTLIPIEGPATAGSRLSLPAMRVLGAPLTGLPEITVYAN